MGRTLSERAIRKVTLLREDQDVGSAVRAIVDEGLPALPVVDEKGKLKGIFGEREFIGAIFPGYLKEIRYAGFLSHKLEERLELREQCFLDPVGKYMTTEHVDVGDDYADVQLAEIYLHHRVLVVPVVRDGEVLGVISRSDFFRALVEGSG